MGTYTVGSTGTYTDFSAAEAALTLPEVGGTIYELSGTISIEDTLSESNYSNGLTVRAASGEEADGKGGGTAIYAARLNIGAGLAFTSPIVLEKIRVRTVAPNAAGDVQLDMDSCVIGEGTAIDSFPYPTNLIGTATNCIFVDGADDNAIVSGTTTTFSIDQCTLIDASRYNVVRGIVTNCFAIGGGSGDFLITEAASDYNASGDSSAPGSTNYQSRTTADLEDYAGGDYNLASGSSLNTAGSGGGRIGALLSIAATSPTVTGPPTGTQGTEVEAVVTDGTDITEFSLVSGSFSRVQTNSDTVTAAVFPYIPTSGEDVAVATGVTTAGIPLKADIIGTSTPYTWVQRVTDGSTPDTSAFTPSIESTRQVVQSTIAEANTTSNQSMYGSDLMSGPEDGIQFTAPNSVDGVTLVFDVSGNLTVNEAELLAANNSITWVSGYFFPSTGSWEPLAVTLTEGGLNVVSPLRNPLRSPLVTPLTSALH